MKELGTERRRPVLKRDPALVARLIASHCMRALRHDLLNALEERHVVGAEQGHGESEPEQLRRRDSVRTELKQCPRGQSLGLRFAWLW